jgi:hypothetical protein
MGLQVLGYSVLWAGISGMRWDELSFPPQCISTIFGIPKQFVIL